MKNNEDYDDINNDFISALRRNKMDKAIEILNERGVDPNYAPASNRLMQKTNPLAIALLHFPGSVITETLIEQGADIEKTHESLELLLKVTNFDKDKTDLLINLWNESRNMWNEPRNNRETLARNFFHLYIEELTNLVTEKYGDLADQLETNHLAFSCDDRQQLDIIRYKEILQEIEETLGKVTTALDQLDEVLTLRTGRLGSHIF